MTSDLQVVIGLECHARLETPTKLFCPCPNRFGAPPNTLVCPVCLGLPGALPVLSGRAVEVGLRAALALGASIQKTSIFERKNYVYPDLPKGYQISQFRRPLALGGGLLIETPAGPRRIGLIRAHLEEDAGKLIHPGRPGEPSRVDLNRCGTPLLEIVTAPDLRSAAEARWFFEELRRVLLFAGVCDGNMEQGSLRCDANVSLGTPEDPLGGTRREIKNLNSFRFLEQAIEDEIRRQREIIERGGTVRQETRGYDPVRRSTFTQRSKEESHDYRYFREPDLAPLRVDERMIEAAQADLPELPAVLRRRFVEEYGLTRPDAHLLASDRHVAAYLDEVVRAGAPPARAAAWIQTEVLRLLRERETAAAALPVPATALAELLDLVATRRLSHQQAREVFEILWSAPERRVDDIIAERGLRQVRDESTLERLVDAVLADNGSAVADYRAGKKKAQGFLMGQIMRRARGQADAAVARRVLLRRLGE